MSQKAQEVLDKNSWKIWIDTGGTFTDCMAQAPGGEVHRTKVLSSGALRGQLVAQPMGNVLPCAPLPGGVPGLYAGYALHFLDQPAQTYRVTTSDPHTHHLSLDRPVPPSVPAGAHFELAAGEEAPVLATRIVTGTPLGAALPPLEMRLGSTKGTNALLERKGSAVGLLITGGLGDLPEIGTQQRPHLFALDIRKPPRLYTRVVEVHERLDAAGNVLLPLTEAELDRVTDQVGRSGIAVWAVAFLHSYRNPTHEKLLGERLRAAGVAFVSLSAELMPAIKLVPRAQTAIVNAYLSPVINRYLDAVRGKMPAGSPLRVMTSAGGLVGAGFFAPKDSLLSGPAGGVVGAAAVARRSGVTQILTLDMGGTSTDVARYDGEYDYRYDLRVGDAHLQTPALAVETVAAGGGSVCAFDGPVCTVGPESAGAHPGPACYGAGGPLTVTDVNLLLGRLDPAAFGIPLNAAAARRAFDDVRQKAGATDVTDEGLLAGFLQIANERMADAIRRVSVQRGYDPGEYTLLAFGGAGGQHACRVAALLGMRRVLVPADAGLLSAYGMGRAAIERLATRQLLRPLPEADLPGVFEGLSREAAARVTAEGFAPGQVSIVRRSLFLRFAGQDAALEIPFAPENDPVALFRKQYQALFGHWIENRPLEVESAKVIAAARAADPVPGGMAAAPYVPQPYGYQRLFADGAWRTVPAYRWPDLEPGAQLAGPALLVSPTSTTVVEPGWAFRLDAAGNGLLHQTEPAAPGESPAAGAAAEAVQLALFTNRFTAVAAEMGALLERTAFSVNVKERLDFSCAVLDAEGYLVVNAPHIPVHLGSLGLCVRAVMAALPMEPGDVVVTNHPGFGGSHLPDITLISPVHDEAGRRIGFIANRAHHAEIGGKRPGSMPPDARNLAEEGVVIPPAYLVRRGEAQWEAIGQLLTAAPFPTRAVHENLADLRAALAAVGAGQAAMRELCRAHGAERVVHFMVGVKRYAAGRLRERLAQLPPGEYRAEEFLDDGSRLAVGLRVADGRLRVDFEGTADTHPRNLNATPAIVTSAVVYVLRLLVDEDIPLNEGLLEAVDLHIPPGLLNPDFPADPFRCPAVVGGNTETSQRVVDTLLKALGLAAGSQGTMNNVVFGNETFGYYETIGGGTGAGPGFAGASAVHQHMTNTRITDPEVMELRYPVRLERFAVRRGSGGAGSWPGGDGILREIRFLQPVSLTVLAEHRRTAPYGLAGGEPGQPGRQTILRADGTGEPLDGSGGAEMRTGDRLVIETPGGGGYGRAGQAGAAT